MIFLKSNTVLLSTSKSDDFCLEIDLFAARTDDIDASGGSIAQRITRSLGRKLGQSTVSKCLGVVRWQLHEDHRYYLAYIFCHQTLMEYEFSEAKVDGRRGSTQGVAAHCAPCIILLHYILLIF